MAEEDVNYSSVVFRNKNSSSPADKKEEETVYDEVKVANEVTELSDGKTDKKGSSQCRRLICCLGILCVILLLSFVAVVVYAVINQNLTDVNNKLSSENENLRRDNNNLNQSVAALENKTSNLTVKNQELEIQINNLTRKIQDLEANWHELNVSRAQWSFEAYCYGNNRLCYPCQDEWTHSQSSCYAINNFKRDKQKSWEGAREDCRGKISDLVVIASEKEKNFINDNSWPSNDITGYWIGLRVKDMKWQWIDGSDLTKTSWIDPPTDGHCAISVQGRGLRSVNCSERNAWICEKRSIDF